MFSIHQELLQIIEELKKELFEKNREIRSMESRIREEVCQEMSQQIVEIEEQYRYVLIKIRFNWKDT